MSVTDRRIHAPVDVVWSVLADGWTYPLWVVGASRMRDVDEHWPGVGARLHHSVGAWPLLLNDTTSVLETTPGSMIRLRARAWPTGAAEVRITLTAVGAETDVRMEETSVAGPARLIPTVLEDPLLHRRNIEALRRLAHLAERGAALPTST